MSRLQASKQGVVLPSCSTNLGAWGLDSGFTCVRGIPLKAASHAEYHLCRTWQRSLRLSLSPFAA